MPLYRIIIRAVLPEMQVRTILQAKAQNPAAVIVIDQISVTSVLRRFYFLTSSIEGGSVNRCFKVPVIIANTGTGYKKGLPRILGSGKPAAFPLHIYQPPCFKWTPWVFLLIFL